MSIYHAKYADYSELTDDALCALARQGDREAEEALVARYTRLVRQLARPYFLAGGDSDDLVQEGMIGLIYGVREYDAGNPASFAPTQKLVSATGCIPPSGLPPVTSTRR